MVKTRYFHAGKVEVGSLGNVYGETGRVFFGRFGSALQPPALARIARLSWFSSIEPHSVVAVVKNNFEPICVNHRHLLGSNLRLADRVVKNGGAVMPDRAGCDKI